MARLSFDGQSFSIDHRRIWLVGAGIDYARTPNTFWRSRIAAAKQAGFNTIVVTCPWIVHEPRKGRFTFSGDADVKTFVEECVSQGLYVGLRIGPNVGAGYDGGGMPSWLSEVDGIVMREPNPTFLERVGIYFRKLLTQVSALQADALRTCGIIFVQAEQSWHCTNDDIAETYLSDLTKHIRENGISVPVVNANAFWAEGRDVIETWNGWDDLLVNLRQMRAFQPNAPRMVTSFFAAEHSCWGDEFTNERSWKPALYNFAQILSAGAQPMVAPFHGGTNFGFLAGRIPGREDGFLTTAAVLRAPLGEAGMRGEKYAALKRIATFAAQFGSIFADLDPDYQPVTVALDHVTGSANPGARGVSVVPLRGAQGRVVFVFGDPDATNQHTTLLLDHGVPVSLNLGDQSVGWYLIDADLGGVGWLDFANLCPFAIIDRSLLVLFGPAEARGHISINESLLEITVPTGERPRIEVHQDITLVICNEAQIDRTYLTDKQVFVGASGIDDAGRPIPSPDFTQLTTIDLAHGAVTEKTAAHVKKMPSTRLESWLAAPAMSQADGTNHRYASLGGPETLDACGAPAGYGWYRVSIKSDAARKRSCIIPEAGNRMVLFLDGEPLGIVGPGPGAMGYRFDLKLTKGEHTLVGLADHLGRFSDGNDFGRMKGWFGHLYEVKSLRTSKPRVVEGQPVDPFRLRNFIMGQSRGRMLSDEQILWTFTHRKKAPVIVVVDKCVVPGMFLMNDSPVAFFAGSTGETSMRLVLNPEEDYFRRGANDLRFAPDVEHAGDVESIIAAVTILECVENLTEGCKWAFARWESPPKGAFAELSKTDLRTIRKTPCWWRTTFEMKETDLPKWFDTTGLSKGVVFVNGENIGRYFTATVTHKRVGPQTRLYIPDPILKPGENEIVLFDEHGFEPSKTKVLYSVEGEFEG